MSDVVVIGGGPAGCMAAIMARKNGHNVILIEKNSSIGKKLNITGKGRCNITYSGNNEYFLENVVNNPKFLMSAINAFDNHSLVKYLDELKIETKLERGNRIFLKSDDAKELSTKLQMHLRKIGVQTMFNTGVHKVASKDGKIHSVVTLDGKEIKCDACVIATGGKSYPGTGSTGDGYRFAKELGHNISYIKAALVPIKCFEKEMCKQLQGLTLKNVSVKIVDANNLSKPLYTNFGEMMFTHFGITGPIVLSASSKINSIDNINEKMRNGQIKCVIDLKPALTEEQLYKRIGRDFENYSNKEYKNGLIDLLPKSIIPMVIQKSNIPGNKKINQITKEEKNHLINAIKNFEITPESLFDVEAGIVTSGGVNAKEINPKTMESKIVKNLYFAGEVIDVDAYTGGFNLQIAFSTGYVAGMNII